MGLNHLCSSSLEYTGSIKQSITSIQGLVLLVEIIPNKLLNHFKKMVKNG